MSDKKKLRRGISDETTKVKWAASHGWTVAGNGDIVDLLRRRVPFSASYGLKTRLDDDGEQLGRFSLCKRYTP